MLKKKNLKEVEQNYKFLLLLVESTTLHYRITDSNVHKDKELRTHVYTNNNFLQM